MNQTIDMLHDDSSLFSLLSTASTASPNSFTILFD